MDSWRRQILADIGISTWVGRDQLPSLALLNPDVPDLEVASPQAQARPAAAAVPERVADQARTNARTNARTHAGTTLAALADSLDGGSKRVPAPRGHSPEPSLPDLGQAAAEPVRYPEVACLWSGNAVLFCIPGELQGQVRLAKDILASAANSWSAPTEQVVFRWSELQASGFASADADRALLAFAEKRIEVTTARWVLCTPSLQPLLTQLGLPAQTELLGLSELRELARNADLKQQLWKALHGEQPAKAPGEPSTHG